jgi:hypothetical protein
MNRNDLAEFVRSMGERLEPQDAGLPAGTARLGCAARGWRGPLFELAGVAPESPVGPPSEVPATILNLLEHDPRRRSPLESLQHSSHHGKQCGVPGPRPGGFQ